MSQGSARFEAVAVLEEIHASVALEALDAAGLVAEAVPVQFLAQLDYFRPHRLPLVELRVEASDLERARRVLARLADEVEEEALVQSGMAEPLRGGEATTAHRGAQEATVHSAPGMRRARWVVAAALATMAIATPLLTRGRGVGERIRRAFDPSDRGQDRITGPRAVEPVQRELEQAGLR